MKKGVFKRGLSPVIATVLLIGMVTVTGLIIFSWFQGFNQEAILKFDKNIQLSCIDVQFTSSYSGSNLLISNTGVIPIYDFKIKVEQNGNYHLDDLSSSSSWPINGLDTGSTFSGNYDPGVSGATLTIIPVLRGQKQNGGTYVSYDCSSNGQSI